MGDNVLQTALNAPAKRRHTLTLERYALSLTLAGVALIIRAFLPVATGNG